MQKNNKLKIVLALIIVLGSAVVILKKESVVNKQLSLQEKNNIIINKILKNDEKTILDSSAGDLNLQKAITRLCIGPRLRLPVFNT